MWWTCQPSGAFLPVACSHFHRASQRSSVFMSVVSFLPALSCLSTIDRSFFDSSRASIGIGSASVAGASTLSAESFGPGAWTGPLSGSIFSLISSRSVFGGGATTGVVFGPGACSFSYALRFL